MAALAATARGEGAEGSPVQPGDTLGGEQPSSDRAPAVTSPGEALETDLDRVERLSHHGLCHPGAAAGHELLPPGRRRSGQPILASHSLSHAFISLAGAVYGAALHRFVASTGARAPILCGVHLLQRLWRRRRGERRSREPGVRILCRVLRPRRPTRVRAGPRLSSVASVVPPKHMPPHLLAPVTLPLCFFPPLVSARVRSRPRRAQSLAAVVCCSTFRPATDTQPYP